jgi:hypothetical protein
MINNFPERLSFTKKGNSMSFHNGMNRFLVNLNENGMADFYLLEVEKQYYGNAVWNGRKFRNPPTLDSTDPMLITYIETKMSEYLPFYNANRK